MSRTTASRTTAESIDELYDAVGRLRHAAQTRSSRLNAKRAVQASLLPEVPIEPVSPNDHGLVDHTDSLQEARIANQNVFASAGELPGGGGPDNSPDPYYQPG